MTRQRAPERKKKNPEDKPAQTSETPAGFGTPTKLLLTVLPLIAAFLTAGGVFLHAIGAITHRTFLGEMGVPSDLFPKDVSWMLINGYYALFDRWLLIFKVLTDETGKFIGYSFGIAVITLLYWFLYRWNPKGWERIASWSSWAKASLRFFALCIAIVGTIPGAVCAVMLAMLIIGAPGEFAGQAYAEKLRDRYAKGCTAKAPCTTVLNSGAVIITGVVLDASPNHLALYDPKTRLSHVLKMDDVELRRAAFNEK